MPKSNDDRKTWPATRLAAALLLSVLPGAPALADGLPITVHPPLTASPMPFERSFPGTSTTLPIVTPQIRPTVEAPKTVERLRSLIDDCRRSADHTPPSAMPPECNGIR